MSTPFQITVDCTNADAMATFWSRALGYSPIPTPEGFSSWESFAEQHDIDQPAPGTIRTIVDEAGNGPAIKFVRSPRPANQRPSFNFELRPGDPATKNTLIDDLTAAGARLVERHEGVNGWWAILADPEGNEFSVI